MSLHPNKYMAIVRDEYCKECDSIMRHVNNICLTCACKRKRSQTVQESVIKESEEMTKNEKLLNRIQELEKDVESLKDDVRLLLKQAGYHD